MLMSHAAMSAGSIGLPRFGACARTFEAARATPKANARGLYVDMLHLAVAGDLPTRRTIVVLSAKRGDRQRPLALAADGEKLRARRLDIPSLVPRAALQDGGAAVPAPRRAEACEGFALHRLLQRRLCPTLAAVGRDHDF